MPPRPFTVRGTRTTGYVPTVQADGTIAWAAAVADDAITPNKLKTGGTDGYMLVKNGASWTWVNPATQAELDAEATARAAGDTATQAAAEATAASALSTHAALTTSAHGGIVASSDSRLTDFRGYKKCSRAGVYVGAEAGVMNTLAVTLNRAYWTLFESDGLRTYDRIGVWSQTGAVGSVTRLGRYADNGYYPGALLFDDGTVDTSVSSSQQDITISWTPAIGRYWLCAVPQTSGTPTLGAIQNTVGFGRPNGSGGSGGWFLAGVTGTLSGSPVGASNDIAQCVRVVLRVQS